MAPYRYDIVATGQLGLKAGAELQERGEAAAQADLARCGLQDTADALEEGRLARAVVTDDTQGLAFADGETDVLKRVKDLGRTRFGVQQALFQRLMALVVNLELLGDAFDVDHGRHQSSDSNSPSRRPKIISATKKATSAMPKSSAFNIKNLSNDHVGRTSMIGCGATVDLTIVLT